VKLVSVLKNGLGVGVVVAMVALGGCAGDKSAPPSNAGGGANVDGGASSSGGSDNGGNGATGGYTGGPQVVPRALITDFSEIAEGTIADLKSPSISWGDSYKGLTGGTFLYQQADADALSATVTNSALHLTGSIAAGHYDGFGFYFGPDQGSDASAYTGFSFTISGSLGNSTLDIQMQMTPDYPLNQNNKGTCDYISADAGAWVYCVNPHATLPTLLSGDVTATAELVQVPFTSLTGGNPVSALDPMQLLGIQFQFNCGSTACTVDITLDDLTFYPGT